MQREKGFTLAEVLITLTIIGVVASLTMPVLMSNTSQAKIGPSLSKFVNTFENAVSMTMQDNSAYRLVDANSGASTPNLPVDDIAKNMLMIPTTEAYKYYPPNGTTATTIEAGSAYVLKDGSLIGITKRANIGTAKGAYRGIIADVIVDIDGKSGQNRAGRDVFQFMLDNSGTLIPFGSAAHKYIESTSYTTCNMTGTELKNGLACTGSVADNGWKASY